MQFVLVYGKAGNQRSDCRLAVIMSRCRPLSDASRQAYTHSNSSLNYVTGPFIENTETLPSYVYSFLTLRAWRSEAGLRQGNHLPCACRRAMPLALTRQHAHMAALTVR